MPHRPATLPSIYFPFQDSLYVRRGCLVARRKDNEADKTIGVNYSLPNDLILLFQSFLHKGYNTSHFGNSNNVMFCNRPEHNVRAKRLIGGAVLFSPPRKHRGWINPFCSLLSKRGSADSVPSTRRLPTDREHTALSCSLSDVPARLGLCPTPVSFRLPFRRHV